MDIKTKFEFAQRRRREKINPYDLSQRIEPAVRSNNPYDCGVYIPRKPLHNKWRDY